MRTSEMTPAELATLRLAAVTMSDVVFKSDRHKSMPRGGGNSDNNKHGILLDFLERSKLKGGKRSEPGM